MTSNDWLARSELQDQIDDLTRRVNALEQADRAQRQAATRANRLITHPMDFDKEQNI